MKPPAALISPAAFEENTPALVTVTVPPALTGAFTLSTVPVKARLPLSVVAPPSVVVPVPADCVKFAAVTAPLAVTLVAVSITMSPSAALPPTVPLMLTLPVPGRRVRLRAVPSLSTVPTNAISPAPAPVDKMRWPVSTLAPVTVIAPPAAGVAPAVPPLVSISPPRFTVAPVSPTTPPTLMPAAWVVMAPVVSVPPVDKVTAPPVAVEAALLPAVSTAAVVMLPPVEVMVKLPPSL